MRKFAAKQGITEEASLEAGLQEKATEFVEDGTRVKSFECFVAPQKFHDVLDLRLPGTRNRS